MLIICYWIFNTRPNFWHHQLLCT